MKVTDDQSRLSGKIGICNASVVMSPLYGEKARRSKFFRNTANETITLQTCRQKGKV